MGRSVTILLWLGYVGLLLVLLAVALRPDPDWPRSLRLLFLITPLLLPLRGLWYARPASYVWISLLSLFYFSASVFVLAATPGDALGRLELVTSVLVFLGALGCARLRRRAGSA